MRRIRSEERVRLPVEYAAEFRQDAAYALRVLAKSPGFTLVGILSLAIGIGMCSVILSESNGLLRSAPGIVVPSQLPSQLLTIRKRVSYPYFEQYRDRRDVVASAAAARTIVPFAVAATEDNTAPAERVFGQIVSPEYFSTVGVKPLAGRLFDPAMEKFGAPPAVILSERFWRTHLHADPDAIGRRLRLNGRPATVLGIAASGFLGIWPWNPADVFLPATSELAAAPELAPDPVHRNDLETFQIVLRLKSGVSIPAAEAALDATTRTLDRENGLELRRDRKGRLVSLIPAGTFFRVTPELRAFIYTSNAVLWCLVLSLVCANLANLLLASASLRRRELAIRLALGASRIRLVRQLLTESVLLSISGGIAGVALAYGITHFISSLQLPGNAPVQLKVEPDFRVLVFTLAIAVFAGIGFGLSPALAATGADPNQSLRQGVRTVLRPFRRFGLRNIFVAYQMAASLMLLLITWYVVLGYRNTAIEPGFSTAGLNLLSVDPARDGYSTERAAKLLQDLPDELSHVNGVREIAVTGGVPFANLVADQPNTVISAPAQDHAPEVPRPAFRERVGANYFATLGVPLVRGREFDSREMREGAHETAIPAILNQTAARSLFGDSDPIGGRIREGDSELRVIGVARDVRSGFLMPKPVATVFLPFTLEWFGRNQAERLTVMVRSAPGRDVLESLHSEIASVHPDLLIFDVHTMRENLERLNSFIDWSSSIYVVLGVFALLLACIGLSGITAYAVARRTREIGVRTALGATASQVQRMMLREGAALSIAGSALGFAGAFTLSRVLSSAMEVYARSFAMCANQPVLLFGAPLLLATLAILACYIPAPRAARINPVTALREE